MPPSVIVADLYTARGVWLCLRLFCEQGASDGIALGAVSVAFAGNATAPSPGVIYIVSLPATGSGTVAMHLLGGVLR